MTLLDYDGSEAQDVFMPRLRADRVKHRIAEKDISSETLAKAVGITCGSLRNVVAGRDPLNLRRVYRLGDALRCGNETAREVVADILAADGGEGVPDEPPPQPDAPKPKPQRKEKAGRGPRRVDDTARGVA